MPSSVANRASGRRQSGSDRFGTGHSCGALKHDMSREDVACASGVDDSRGFDGRVVGRCAVVDGDAATFREGDDELRAVELFGQRGNEVLELLRRQRIGEQGASFDFVGDDEVRL